LHLLLTRHSDYWLLYIVVSGSGLMASIIESSALLRQRYLIKQLLGQGGFGRTYLALDRERFDELCVLKEFTVSYQDETLVAKAKALFAREASILHQIQHPQIPRFWAAFEWEERLFLVQDYIQGSTYRTLLQARRDRGATLSEAEVLHLLNHLLPVLAYLHDKQIVHRDISPENIVLQPPEPETNPDQIDLTLGLPFLLDFGSVKEATSGLTLGSTMTRVGKVGYAPPEQLQTGNVKPHSDLYALAATCLVLLTGREPHSLLDSLTLDWHWQPYVRVSREFANILNRMLALQPADRYASAADVHRDLQRLLGVFAPMVHMPQLLSSWQTLVSQSPVSRSSARPTTPISGSASTTSASTTSASTTTLTRPSTGVRSRLPSTQLPFTQLPFTQLQWPPEIAALKAWQSDRLLSRLAVATSLLLTGLVGVTMLRGPLPISQQAFQPSPDLVTRPNRPNQPTASLPEPIEFSPGGVTTVEQGNLLDSQTKIYTLRAAKGQIMSVILEGAGVKMNLLRSNQHSIDNSARQTRSWSGRIPASEDYQIQITGSGGYSLDVTITPTGSPQDADIQRLKFLPPASTLTVTGEIVPQQLRRYIVKASPGQSFGFKVLQGDVKVTTIGPDGQVLGSSATGWLGKVNRSGDYVFEVSTQKREDYALSFQLQ
jgi:serine/threonine protein kinase